MSATGNKKSDIKNITNFISKLNINNKNKIEYVYKYISNEWKKEKIDGNTTSFIKNDIIVTTFNVWFSNFKQTERIQTLIHLISTTRCDICCLQEMTLKTMKDIKKSTWIQKNFYISSIDDEHWCSKGSNKKSWYGTLILSKVKPVNVGLLKFDSIMHRNFLFFDIPVEVGKTKEKKIVRVGTTHLESKNYSETRKIQLNEIFDCLDIKSNKNIDASIFMGDTNIDANSKENKEVFESRSNKFIDAWEGENGLGNTRDTVINNMNNTKEVQEARIDRIFYSNNLFKHKIKIIGNIMINKTKDNKCIYPSDHFGLTSTISFNEKPTQQNNLNVLDNYIVTKPNVNYQTQISYDNNSNAVFFNETENYRTSSDTCILFNI